MGEQLINQAFVLGAGLGARMRPLTDTIPKPLVQLAGKPLIDHVIDRLDEVGIEKIVVNVHYLAEKLEAHLSQVEQPQIIISDERDALLDTGGGIAKALPHFGNAPFFIHNSDSYWIEGEGLNLARMIYEFDSEHMDSLLLLADRKSSIGIESNGDFSLKENGTVKRPAPGEVTDYIFTGVSIAHPRMFANCPTGAFSLNKLWDKAIENKRLYGIKHQGLWMHVGTSDALKDSEHCIQQSTLSI